MAIVVTPFVWPVMVLISYPESKFQIFIVLSQLADTMNLSSELSLTVLTISLCPARVVTSIPVEIFQILMLLSLLPETTNLPSELIATE